MSIKVTCPNGHELQVKSEFAGKSGLCPHCKARIIVPQPAPEEVSEDDLLRILGAACTVPRQPTITKPSRPPEESKEVRPEKSKADVKPEKPKEDVKAEESKVKVKADGGGSSLLRRNKVCPTCCEIVTVSHADCPHCHTSLSEWTFPLPEEALAHKRRHVLCHYLGIRKHGDVLVIRFGEHRILDEATVKKFADELFFVADRPDCKNLLLSFTGVVGLSSAMLGILLMLRKKIAEKPGKLKLCQVGAEIMDVFHATKLGQLFEIIDNPEQALKAFD